MNDNNKFATPVEGETYEGEVSKVADYGIFVKTTAGFSGLCHISEIFEERTYTDLNMVFKSGDKVTVKVIKYDAELRRTNFSMKGIDQSPEVKESMMNAPKREYVPRAPREGGYNNDRGSSNGGGYKPRGGYNRDNNRNSYNDDASMAE